MRLHLLALAILCTILCGCNESDPVVQYRIPKEATTRPVSSAAKQVWFFKLMANTEKIDSFGMNFIELIRSLRLERGVPQYDLPDGWTASAGPPPIDQTIKIADDEADGVVTVTRLPSPPGASSQYLKANVDRWRRQLGLPPMAGTDWLQQAREKQEIIVVPKDDLTITLVRLQGQSEKHGDTQMFVAIVSEQPLIESATTTQSPSSSPSANPIQYKLPDGWRESPGNSMRLVSLAAEHESGSIDVSVTRLGGGGDALSNINRWRGQVDLKPVTDDELTELIEDLEVAGHPAQYVMLAGESQSIAAAMFEQDGAKWFFKMQGPTPSVQAEEGRFREFLNSVSFDQDDSKE